MADLVRINASETTDIRPFTDGKGELRAVELDGRAVGVATFQPGWRWSQHVKPIVGGDSCQSAHTGYFISGRMHVMSDSGQGMDYGPGDFATMAPGHDAWVLGDEPAVFIDWTGYADYARPAS